MYSQAWIKRLLNLENEQKCSFWAPARLSYCCQTGRKVLEMTNNKEGDIGWSAACCLQTAYDMTKTKFNQGIERGGNEL